MCINDTIENVKNAAALAPRFPPPFLTHIADNKYPENSFVLSLFLPGLFFFFHLCNLVDVFVGGIFFYFLLFLLFLDFILFHHVSHLQLALFLLSLCWHTQFLFYFMFETIILRFVFGTVVLLAVGALPWSNTCLSPSSTFVCSSTLCYFIRLLFLLFRFLSWNIQSVHLIACRLTFQFVCVCVCTSTKHIQPNLLTYSPSQVWILRQNWSKKWMHKTLRGILGEKKGRGIEKKMIRQRQST